MSTSRQPPAAAKGHGCRARIHPSSGLWRPSPPSSPPRRPHPPLRQAIQRHPAHRSQRSLVQARCPIRPGLFSRSQPHPVPTAGRLRHLRGQPSRMRLVSADHRVAWDCTCGCLRGGRGTSLSHSVRLTSVKGGQGVLGQILASSNANVVVRNVAHLGVNSLPVLMHRCEARQNIGLMQMGQIIPKVGISTGACCLLGHVHFAGDMRRSTAGRKPGDHDSKANCSNAPCASHGGV
jgi:hypothetical protein